MPSPFPGMNPFLEQPDAWQDFHDRYVPALADALAAVVRPHFIVKVEQHLFIHEPPAEDWRLVGHGDISLARPKKSDAAAGTTATLTSPLMARLPVVDFEKHL